MFNHSSTLQTLVQPLLYRRINAATYGSLDEWAMRYMQMDFAGINAGAWTRELIIRMQESRWTPGDTSAFNLLLPRLAALRDLSIYSSTFPHQVVVSATKSWSQTLTSFSLTIGEDKALGSNLHLINKLTSLRELTIYALYADGTDSEVTFQATSGYSLRLPSLRKLVWISQQRKAFRHQLVFLASSHFEKLEHLTLNLEYYMDEEFSLMPLHTFFSRHTLLDAVRLKASSAAKEELLRCGMAARHIAFDDNLPLTSPLDLLSERTTEITATIAVGNGGDIDTGPLRSLFVTIKEASTAPNLQIIRIRWPQSWDYQSIWKEVVNLARSVGWKTEWLHRTLLSEDGVLIIDYRRDGHTGNFVVYS
jgi:hypothetical protein